ncbi:MULTISPECIES: M1 family metallopeptidase [Myroides]|uniref:M1 family peptidase n=1 Tax=Myroides albus TaxID=2562892 RepID=A0A6I3LHZ7_9FLAO|nr:MULTISPECIES: M1 family metallopeptidase [Myroides]MTG97873.1 M1 family peptidase [Myroides albus]MVX34247.1 M1 family peptidase [Myroides sp. LoEW2-1]UVD81060.1 M1 family metallopeptidase [Myroides albus]
MKKLILTLTLTLTGLISVDAHNNPNPGYWQQHVDYEMDVKVDVKKFTYKGTQKLVYTNNSNDTLKNVYYHLYYNAFQPGSDMDALLNSIPDPDSRMVDTKNIRGRKVTESKITKLKPDEIGFVKVSDLKQNGQILVTKTVGTILEVELKEPLAPNTSTELTMTFEGQAPKMVRRSGRQSKEGVALSMAQWFPKMAEFDFEGWHTEQYLGREFHSVWGNFDVKITIDKEYTVGGTGILVNNNEVGHGYQDAGTEVATSKKDKTLTWHFKAENVLDFTWAADNNYIHDTYQGPNGVKLHFLYKNNPAIIENWKKLQPITAQLMEFFNENVGEYPYEQYSVIQGGDGGMEYSMCTLITGERNFESLVGVTAHELAHSWFQHALATNETKHEWIDEGFTTFISDLAMVKILPEQGSNPFASNYKSYYKLVEKNMHEPLSTHSDHYLTNRAYSTSAYSRGAIFLTQLSYIIGWDNMMASLKKFYSDYKFSHPTPNDFKRTAERVSGAVLDWYMIDWTLTNNTIDYAVQFVEEVQKNQTLVTLERIGRSGMPLDILVVYEDDTMETFYIPYTSMHWTKPNQYVQYERTVLDGWGWAQPEYKFIIPKAKGSIKSIMIDPSQFMADVNQENNLYQK